MADRLARGWWRGGLRADEGRADLVRALAADQWLPARPVYGCPGVIVEFPGEEMRQRSTKRCGCEEVRRTTLFTSSLLLLISLLPLNTIAQLPPILTRDAFVRMVLENHPMARQAALRPELGEAALRSARGGFDPMATAAYDEKQFDDKNYFQLFDAGLKVPTWYGVELF